MENRRLGMMDIPLMPENGPDDTCIINGDAMIWAAESAKRFCNVLDEKLPKPSSNNCGQTDASATSYLMHLQSTGEFQDEYQYYLKEQWGERSVFAPYMEIPACQDEDQSNQKSGVVERNAIRTLIYNESATCKLFTNKTDCLDHGSCEWREDFGGRCRLDMASKAPTPEPTVVPTTEYTTKINIILPMVAMYVFHSLNCTIFQYAYDLTFLRTINYVK